ncbi:hypothetical protein [Gellertiella hungarica]|uniref:Uncharacterized protein n=1 Tax=Gellertiella hungarica TaxID=1572859 RepID=A0A7W6J3V7_9HYPH|nr:hypothetical protein [Gellertiella hungarica]MBB4063378.1 hypothetical protein [Gellertiella hungarica]
MDTTVHETDSAPVSVKPNAPDTHGSADGSRLLGRAEMIDRLAHAMRLRSGLDLPHAYFVEQVKLQLAGSPAFDKSLSEPETRAARRAATYQSAACFEAWAIRD